MAISRCLCNFLSAAVPVHNAVEQVHCLGKVHHESGQCCLLPLLAPLPPSRFTWVDSCLQIAVDRKVHTEGTATVSA